MLHEIPREFAFHGVYVPTLSLIFVLALVLSWGLDTLLGALDAYRFTWHPALFRVSLFASLFCGMALTLYR